MTPAAKRPSKLDDADDIAASRLARARKNSSGRIALAELPGVDPIVIEVATESVVVDLEEAEDSGSMLGVLPAQVATKKRSASGKTGTVPSWRSLATPPAARGTGGNQRRLNVPCSPDTLKLLNLRDRELIEGGSRWRVNRSLLLSEAIDVLGKDAAPWVDRWERERLEEEPYTASLQGRVDDGHYRRYTLIRYLEDGRTVSAGPLLSIVVREILGT